jgi:hypothetical protein
MRRRGHPESLIRRVVYENPIKFFGQSRNFDFQHPILDVDDWEDKALDKSLAEYEPLIQRVADELKSTR